MQAELARLEEIFSEALPMSAGAERDAFLDRACRGEPGLRTQIDRLLASSASAGNFIADAEQAASITPFSSNQESPGTIIGPYKLLERIGEGGFGSVFMAEQEKPVRRRVALKIIKLGMDTRSVIARFEAERQALAMMDHPHIARVFDAGATETGRPYFVMELVKGTPITAFCDEQCLTVRQRLELFIQVCQAVQHAHNKGVIHRDLKPSNVLAVRHDGTPTVKVIDFGIAKATGDRLTDKTLFTEFRQLIGTPAYMSPEQAGMSDIDVDTRSDIYSLGVLLYELLAGTTPFDAKTLLESGHDEMRRIIREVEPPMPSTRVSEATKRPAGSGGLRAGAAEGSSAAASSPSSLRSCVATSLIRTLRGDLDWIAMKCLEKDRARRYETASALAADVHRHLAGESVVAAPPSRLYRFSKSLRRHRAAAAVIAGFVLLTLVGLIATGSLWRQAADARDAESDQRARAEAINAFIKDMLTAADPAKAKGAKLTVREALENAARKIEVGALHDQPIVEAQIRTTIGETYHSLSLYPEAEAQLRIADRINVQQLGAEHLDTLHTRMSLVEARWQQGFAEVAIAEPNLAALRKILGPDHPDTLRAMDQLGRVLTELGRFDEGEALMIATLEARKRVLGAEHPDTADSMDELGWVYVMHGLPAQAEPLHREAQRIKTEKLGPDHVRTLRSRGELAGCLYNQYRSIESEAMSRALHADYLRILGPDHVTTLGNLGMLAASLNRLGRYAEAEQYQRQILQMYFNQRGSLDLGTIHARRFLAGTLANQGRYEEAETLTRDALHAAKQLFGAEHYDTSLRLMDALLRYLLGQKKNAEAEEVARELLAIQRRLNEPSSISGRSVTYGMLHSALVRQQKNEEALSIEREHLDYALELASRPNAGPRDFYRAARILLTTRTKRLRDPARGLELAVKAATSPTATSEQIQFAARQLITTPIESLRDVRKGLELAVSVARNSNASAEHLNFAAWQLLTIEPVELRDPALAVEFSRRANQLGNYTNSDHMDTLALALFRTGEVTEAIETQKRAIKALSENARYRAKYERQLAEFEAAVGAANTKELTP